MSSTPALNPDPATIHVLYVDDEPDFADMAATFLEREDNRFSIDTATNASDALARLADNGFECIVSDHDMPGQNGIEFLNTVREAHPDLPFILFTGKGSEEIASEAISAGVTDYLQKGSGTEQYELLANRVLNAVGAYRSQQLAQERTRRLETLISNLPGIVYRCRNDPKWPMETVEGEVKELTGYSPDVLENDDVLWGEEIIHPDDREEVWEAVQEGLSEDGTFEVTYRIVTNEGTTRWMWERGGGVYDDEGDLEALEGFITDVTERKEREQELHRTAARLKALFKNSPDMINVHDMDGTIVDPNPRLCEATGYDAAELAGMKVWDIDQTIEPEEAYNVWERMEVGTRHRLEGVFQHKDGSSFPVEVHIQRINLDGNARFIVISRDITERKERERELEAQTERLAELTAQLEEQYRHLFEEAPVMAVVTRNEDDEPIVEECNQLFLDTLGYDRSEVIGHDLAEFYTPESTEALLEQGGYQRALSGEFVREDRDLVTAEGETVETLLRAVPRHEADDTTSGTLAMYIDITERKQLERKTERLKEFTGIVSHDLRNPLNVAEGHLELAYEECDSDHLDAIADAHDRMKALIEDLLTLAREGDRVGDTEAVDLAELSEDCWRNVETANATLRTPMNRMIRADRSRLTQLLENLIRNAVKHGGDDVTVTLGELDDGFYVEDDGPGIPEDERDNVFDAGYSTTTDGTGFGLSIVERIAGAHGWDIRVTESEDGGVRFEITGVKFTAE